MYKQNQVLYMRGMNADEDMVSASESDEEGNIWDDSMLNNSYEKALNVVKAEIAKRVAMTTNSNPNEENKTIDTGAEKSKKKKDNTQRSTGKQHKKGTNLQWMPGMPCRTIYQGDGLEYEAFVLKIIDDKECVIRFLGYDDSEIVQISSLKPSLGREEGKRQVQEAIHNNDDGFTSPIADTSEVSSPESFERPTLKKKPRSRKHTQTHTFDLPLPTLNMDFVRNLGESELPMAAPPPMNFTTAHGLDSEDQALSSMLISWYMSGYYAGLYHGLRSSRSKENRRRV